MIRTTLLAASLVAASAAHADTVHYDFQDWVGSILAPASVPAHVQASDVTLVGQWGGFCWNTDLGVTNDFACGGWGSSSVSFTVTAEAGWVFDVNSFTFQGLGLPDDGTGPTSYAVYSSLDGFADALIEGSLVGQVMNQRYNYNAGLTAQGLSGPLELRIVSTGRDETPASAWLLDNLRLDINVRKAQVVPEPASVPLVALALCAAFWARPARRRPAGA